MSTIPDNDDFNRPRVFRLLNLGNAVLVVGLFCGVAALNYFVDPYNVFGSDTNRWEKEPVVAKDQQVLWKLASFRNAPASHILIGDSRMAQIDPEMVSRRFGANYANLATGGASVAEMIGTFHRVARGQEIENVVMNVAFFQFNTAFDTNRLVEAEQLLDQPWRYLFDPRISIASLSVLRYSAKSGGGATFKPPLDREAFWDFQVQVTARNNFRNYQFNEPRFEELLAIRHYCRENGIRLTIVLFPEHGDYVRRTADFGQREAYDAFRHRIAREFSHVVDFQGRDDWNAAERYSDPLHFAGREQAAIVDEVFGVALAQ